MSYKSRIETLQETHKYLDRQCTDAEKKLTRPTGELRKLKKQKLQVRDQIEELRRKQDEEAV
ncbi:DUF465 domain-containing protein [bacterium]|nr:DUF465 domain-containing protein [bacterium]